MKSSAENKRIAFYLFFFIFSVYLLTSQGNSIDSSDQQQGRFAVTQSIIEEGDLSIPDGMGVKVNNGYDYSPYGIGQPLLALPFYIIGKTLGGYAGSKLSVSLMNQVVVAVSVVIVFLFITNLGYSKKTALTVTIFYAMGTFAWPQSKHPFDHPVEMLFILLAVFYAMIFVYNGKIMHLMLSSAALGFAFLTRTPAALALPPIYIFLSYSHLAGGIKKDKVLAAIRDCAIYSLIFTPFVLIQLWYNYARFGSLLETGMTLISTKLERDLFAGTPLITGICGFLISPGKGFFYYSPISILFFFSIIGFYKRNVGLTLCILGIASFYLIFLSRLISWAGGWSWGPRYILVITPLLMLPIADFVERVSWGEKKILRWAVLALFGISIGVQIIGVSVDYNRYFFSLQVEKGVEFTSTGGNGVPFIIEPPLSTHFEWDKSPIVYQAVSALNIWKGLKEYRHILEPERVYEPHEALRSFIRFNIFDFWWLYALYAGAPPYLILILLGLLFFVITFCWFRVLKLVKG